MAMLFKIFGGKNAKNDDIGIAQHEASSGQADSFPCVIGQMVGVK